MFCVHFENLGCRLNQNETEGLANYFVEAGFSLYKSGSDPASVILVFVNTCTVTAKAEQKCRRVIRSCVKKFPAALILVSGCYAQLEKNTIEKISSSVLAFPGLKKGALAQFPRYLCTELEKNTQANTGIPMSLMKGIFEQFVFQLRDMGKNNGGTGLQSAKSESFLSENAIGTAEYAFDLATRNFAFHSRASLKVQDGCNSACSFCRIRIARGKSVSLEADEALKRARSIEAAGKHEIVLTGVNLSQYRANGINFSTLLSLLVEGTEHVKFRISSFYPEGVNEEFLRAIRHERICPYIHLSVQSGSERILKLMKRPNNVAHIYEACIKLREIKPDIFLGADIITGFPSETDEDFEKTFQLCEKVGFEHIHSFPFSPRPDTEAFYLRPQVPERVAGERLARLEKLSRQNYERYVHRVEGKIFTGIVENFRDGKKVLTENYLLLPLKEKKNAENLNSGAQVQVKIACGFAELC